MYIKCVKSSCIMQYLFTTQSVSHLICIKIGKINGKVEENLNISLKYHFEAFDGVLT